MGSISQLKDLFEQAKNKKENPKQIYEWSVGNLGNLIDANITDKVSLKSITKGDTIVVAKTSISKIAQEQDGDGDVQLTVESISGTTLVCSSGSDKIELDLLDLRILEAYSMDNSKVRIFVIDLPAKLNKNLFGEALEKSDFNTELESYAKTLDDLSSKILTEYADVQDAEGDEEAEFKKSDVVKKAKKVLVELQKYLDKVNPDVISVVDKRQGFNFRSMEHKVIECINNTEVDYFYLGTGIDGLVYDLRKFKKVMK